VSDEIRPGDVVVCVDDTDCAIYPGASSYKLGAIYRIVAASMIRDGGTGYETYCVQTDRDNPVRDGRVGWASAKRFRKLPPATEAFTRQMRACKPQKQPVDA
jgi:hypothetical protein